MHISQTDFRLGRISEEKTGVVEGSLWMVGISLALFFVPAVNGLIGGLVGGYRVGTLRGALTAAVLPAVAVALLLWTLLAVLHLPVAGFFAGGTVAVLILLSDLGILLGAALGGALAQRRTF